MATIFHLTLVFNMNEIKRLQDDPANLKYLKAQRVLYASAKQIFGVQIFITVILSVVFSFLKLIPKEKVEFDLNAYVALASVLIGFADVLFFNTYISILRTNGAKTQELFDCNLFGLPWNSANSGSKPDKDIVEEYAEKYIPDPKAPLENWYDINLEGLSHARAVLLCQETNLFYDGKLRDHFKSANIITCLLVFVLSFITSLIVDIKISEYIKTVLLPVFPIMILTLKITLENRKSLTSSTELKKFVLQMKARQEEPSQTELRQVQDKIFCSRKDSSLVPEWYYKWRRNRLEKAMQANAQ